MYCHPLYFFENIVRNPLLNRKKNFTNCFKCYIIYILFNKWDYVLQAVLCIYLI